MSKLQRFATNILTCIIFLTSCGQSVPTWQEQYDLGIRYLSEGNYEEAIIAFTAAIEIDPKQAEAYIGLANAYEAKGDLERARRILTDALKIADNSNAIQNRLDELALFSTKSEGILDIVPEPSMELTDDILSQNWKETYSELIYELTSNPYFEGPSSPYSEVYGLYDLDGNGIPELFYGNWQGLDVYSCRNNSAIALGHIGNTNYLYLIPEKNAVWSGGGSCFSAEGCIYVLESVYQNGKLTPDYWEVSEYFPEFDQHEYDPDQYGDSIVYMTDYGDGSSSEAIKYFHRGKPSAENTYIEAPPTGSQALELYTIPHKQYIIENDLALYVTPRLVNN